MTNECEIAAMRGALTRTWFPFFARFSRPRGVQLAAHEPLLAGEDVVVCSPTASGKTEAVLAPLIERHLDRARGTAPQILIVCPTRALVNDTLRRLEPPLARLGLTAHRRTGDHAVLNRKHPPNLLITTPESLDSLLVRHTRFLSTVRAVVLDELHILDGSPRGDQLRLLMERLRRVTARSGGRLQGAITSATIAAPADLGARYLHEPTPILVADTPRLESRWVHCPRPGDVILTLDKIYGRGGERAGAVRARKILVFVNRRNDVETLAGLAHRFGRLGERVFTHHGSLSREERERVEERFLSAPSGVCFATMTLELGIDIGDIDLVVMVEPPTSVAAFLQRVGRGNRRTERARVLGCYRDRGDKARFEHLAASAAKGDLLAPPYVFRSSVVAQQVGSLLMQSRDGWIAPKVVRERLPADVAPIWSEELLTDLMERMRRSDWLVQARFGRYQPGPKLIRSHRLGTMHANLPHEVGGLEVVDEDTGQVLGQVRGAKSDQPMALAGRSRRVLREAEGRLYVSSSPHEAQEADFAPRGRQVITWETARGLLGTLDLPANTLPYLETNEGSALFHFAGSLAGEVLAQHLRRLSGWQVLRGSALAILLEAPLPRAPLPVLTESGLLSAAEEIEKKLAKLAEAGPFSALVPDRLRRDLLESILAIPRLTAMWNASELAAELAPKKLAILADLAKVR